MGEVTDAAGDIGGDAAADAILADLRALAASQDPVPDDAVAAARAAIAWRTMDAELAQLTGELSAAGQLAGTRSGDAPTFLTFEAPTLAVELEVLDTGTGRRLLGQLVPPVAGQVEVRHGGGVTAAAADEMGRFSVTAVTAGPVSLRCVAGDTVIETDWFLA
jgi:hypothetical protein